MSDKFVAWLGAGAAQLGLDLPAAAVARLVAHRQVLLKWAPKVNLTTVLDDLGMAERLYLDSAVVSPLLGGGRVHDVGTGAGFPGLVLKALQPGLAITLSEARRRKVSFLGQAAREMDLQNDLDIRWQRVGWDPPDQTNEHWDEVISRATFPPERWLEVGSRLVAPGGRLWVLAGQPHGQAEPLPDLEKGSLPDGFQVELRMPYRLPFCGLTRWLVGLRRRA